MANSITFTPNWNSSPSATIKFLLKIQETTNESFALKISKPIDYVNDLLEDKIEIDENVAMALSTSLGMPAKFWIVRNALYIDRQNVLEKEFIEDLPTSDANIKYTFYNNIKKDFCQILNYFGVRSIDELNATFIPYSKSIAFKKTTTFTTNCKSIMIWIREAQLHANKMQKAVSPWNYDEFTKEIHAEIFPLVKNKNPESFIPKLFAAFLKLGVYFTIVPPFKGNRCSGATFWYKDNPLIVVSARYLSDDHFWFTLFHEIGHIVLHDLKEIRIQSEDSIYNNSEEEIDANSYAEEALIPSHKIDLYSLKNYGLKTVTRLAINIGITPGIIIGQCQKKQIIPYNKNNFLKKRFNKEIIFETYNDLINSL